MIDSHAHLHSPEFDEDRADVIARARADGLALIIEVGTDLGSSGRAVSLSVEYPDIIRAAVGVHPHDAADLADDVLVELRAMASRPEVVAIGETGLDYYRDLSPREAQRQAFQAQLRLANEVELPAIVHDRDAHEDVLKILLASSRLGECNAVRGVLHCFSGSYAMACDALEAGWYVSVAGPLTYPNAIGLRNLVARLPLDRVLVERMRSFPGD